MLELRQKLQTAATTGNGTVASLGLSSDGYSWLFFIVGSAGVSAGAVQIETAATAAYTGTWQPIGSPVLVGDNTVQTMAIDGVYRHMRARISTNIVGGTVTVTAEVQ